MFVDGSRVTAKTTKPSAMSRVTTTDRFLRTSREVVNKILNG